MIDKELLDTAKAIDQKLNAILAIEAARLQSEDPDLSDSRHPSVESIVAAAGMTQTTIGQLLGKSFQAVSQRLAKDGYAKGKK